eukprot:4085430-Karenia_brevis.AAC.1
MGWVLDPEKAQPMAKQIKFLGIREDISELQSGALIHLRTVPEKEEKIIAELKRLIASQRASEGTLASIHGRVGRCCLTALRPTKNGGLPTNGPMSPSTSHSL